VITRRLELARPLDLVSTLGPLVHGRGDRTIHLRAREAWLALRTADGGATLRLEHDGHTRLTATAWGDGAEAAAAGAADLVGESDDPSALEARHPVLRELQRRHPGLRLPRTRRVFAALVPSVLEQKVTGTEAFRAYAALLARHGEAAPGPRRLVLPPTPQVLAGLPYYAFHPLGVERRRAEVVRRAALCAAWLEGSRDAAEADERLQAVAGIGPWTAAEIRRTAYGDPDAVSVGDFHLPSTVAWALAGEPRGDDARMLDLLEPYRGQRGRVQRLLEVGRVSAPRYGPRMAPRSIAAI